MLREQYLNLIQLHYETHWKSSPVEVNWSFGPIHELPAGFKILRFSPTETRKFYAYATCGMSIMEDSRKIEFFIFSPVSDDSSLCELINFVVHYHRTGAELGWMHMVNFGRPWLASSRCDHGLFSLPYIDGEELERLRINDIEIRVLWLIPITREERDYCKEYGLDALESKFESTGFAYHDPNRSSVVLD